MNNAEFIKGIDEVISGLSKIKNAVSEKSVETPSVAPTVTPTEGETYTVEQLNAMKYNAFKTYAASLGVKCTGTRDEIMARVLKAQGASVEETTEEETVVTPIEAPAEKPTKKKSRKAKKETDEFDELAKGFSEEYTAEEILEQLSEVGVDADEDNYVEKLAEALREGLIEVDDDDDDESEEVADDSAEDETEAEEVEETEEDADEDEEVEEDDSDESDEEEEIDENSYFADFDIDGLNDPDDMTKKRAKAVKSMMKETLDKLFDDKISDKEVKEFVDTYATDDEKELVENEDDMVCLYLELKKRLIDDDGEEHESEDPYEINGVDMCCAHKLKYIEDSNMYVCECCGSEYEE